MKIIKNIIETVKNKYRDYKVKHTKFYNFADSLGNSSKHCMLYKPFSPVFPAVVKSGQHSQYTYYYLRSSAGQKPVGYNNPAWGYGGGSYHDNPLFSSPQGGLIHESKMPMWEVYNSGGTATVTRSLGDEYCLCHAHTPGHVPYFVSEYATINLRISKSLLGDKRIKVEWAAGVSIYGSGSGYGRVQVGASHFNSYIAPFARITQTLPWIDTNGMLDPVTIKIGAALGTNGTVFNVAGGSLDVQLYNIWIVDAVDDTKEYYHLGLNAGTPTTSSATNIYY